MMHGCTDWCNDALELVYNLAEPLTRKQFKNLRGIAMEDRVRSGVYICHCGTNITGTVDVKDVGQFAQEFHGSAEARQGRGNTEEVSMGGLRASQRSG